MGGGERIFDEFLDHLDVTYIHNNSGFDLIKHQKKYFQYDDGRDIIWAKIDNNAFNKIMDYLGVPEDRWACFETSKDSESKKFALLNNKPDAFDSIYASVVLQIDALKRAVFKENK